MRGKKSVLSLNILINSRLLIIIMYVKVVIYWYAKIAKIQHKIKIINNNNKN